ncbi:signal peptidase I [Enterococcus quebecensis]|uniref:Signal peptidase I n=1 Tax=Enterococcus quebecensis TaxID=903983 RepID=A0A1E5GRA3_9ENTE|nr:signal peptidase I [Enterococcus quebecensis]OEG15199.1 signal peptidase I [Enterococcus quebecensis]OJG74777.1 signal peptidase I [Enterococcus quebecensis]
MSTTKENAPSKKAKKKSSKVVKSRRVARLKKEANNGKKNALLKNEKKFFISENKKRKKAKQNLKKKKSRRKKRWGIMLKQIFLEFGASLVLLGVLLYFISFFVFSISKVEGYSMTPSLNNGEWVFVSKVSQVKRFKLVLYRDAESKELAIRRVIGLPGEQIYYENDVLYVNDNEVFERFIVEPIGRAKNHSTKYTEDWHPEIPVIPKGKYLILGDNRPYAMDSRSYGYIDEKEIEGIVEMRLLPIHQIQQF